MTVLVVLESIVLALLIALVVGLLRTHAEVLRRLHELGAGIYETDTTRATQAQADLAGRVADGVAAPRVESAARTEVVDITGVTPRGSAVSVSVGGDDRLTLLAFLSTGCTTCGDFWRAWRDDEPLPLSGLGQPRIVIVTRGPENEHLHAVTTLAPATTSTVMSSEAWTDYHVPASPYFVLVDGRSGVIGEGSAASFAQLRGVLERALSDRRTPIDLRDDPSRVDAELQRAGIVPGHRSLYEWPHGPESPAPDRRSA
ncbi:MAG: hypothetical protein ABIQ73_26235 [Acidimicrobiales bacterium]